MINNLDIYFSNVCNMNCSYCCMHQHRPNISNESIVQALLNGNFINKVKDNLTDTITSISIWGLEPNMNGKYFRHFIYEILNFSPYIKYINIVSNGTNDFFENFIEPLYTYSTDNNRKLKVWILISLDGPPQIMEKHCGLNSYNKVVSGIEKMLMRIPRVRINNIRFRLTLKSTLDKEDLRLVSPKEWYAWRDSIARRFETNHPFVDTILIRRLIPTLKFPDTYTQEDGKLLAYWNIPFDGTEYYECAAGNTSKAISYDGSIYDCHLLKNRNNFHLNEYYDLFNGIYNELLESHQITETFERRLVFNAISRIYCWGVDSINSLRSYILLLSNGAPIVGSKKGA